VLLVIPGAPAERGGLRPADEVLTVDGQPMTRASEIVQRIQAVEPGMTVRLVVQRQGSPLTIVLSPEPRPEMMDVVRQALIGKPAPEFTGELISGTAPAKLAELRGHVVVLDFWATWCGPCAMTLPRLDAWQATYAAKGLRIVGLSNEDATDISAFLVDHKLGYTIARDPDAKAAQDYLLQGVPMLVIIDKAGIVHDVFLGAGNFDAIEAAIVRLL
jgi:thiol-disulfide isomerase/thioredoxin